MGIDWTAILQQILAVVLPMVLAALGIFGSIWLNRLRAKEAASEAVLKDTLSKSVAKQGVNAAEEESAHIEKAGGDPLTGPQKEVIASAFVAERIPEKTPEIIKGDIKASLGATPGVGASVTPSEVIP